MYVCLNILHEAVAEGVWQQVLVSEHNRMENGRYFDISSRSSWRMDHAAQVRRWDLRSLNDGRIDKSSESFRRSELRS